MKVFIRALFLCALCAFGCKQGAGDVCQIDDDCKDGLECNAGTGRCQERGAIVVDAGTSVVIDAAVPVDAQPDAVSFDAAFFDAAPL